MHVFPKHRLYIIRISYLSFVQGFFFRLFQMFHNKVDSLDHPLVTFYLLHFLSSSLDCRCSSTPLLFLSPRYLFILFVLCFSKFFSVALSVFFINMQLKLPNGMCSIIFSISIANLASAICFFFLFIPGMFAFPFMSCCCRGVVLYVTHL